MNCFEKNKPMDKDELNALKMLYLNKEVRIIHGARIHYGKIGKVTGVNHYGLLNINSPSNFTGCDENILVPPDYVTFCVSDGDIIRGTLETLKNPKVGPDIERKNAFTLEKIIHSGPKTIVFFKNGEKVIVSCGENETYDEYTAFCADLAKKIFGSTSRAKKIMKSATVEKKEKKN